jgi:hypothetical protein
LSLEEEEEEEEEEEQREQAGAMHLLNAVMAARMLTLNHESEAFGSEIAFGSVWFFVYVGISCFLVLFAGIMSGLTLGLMSLGRVDLEILERSGTSSEKKQAGKVPDSPFLTFRSDSRSYWFRFGFGFVYTCVCCFGIVCSYYTSGGTEAAPAPRDFAFVQCRFHGGSWIDEFGFELEFLYFDL